MSISASVEEMRAQREVPLGLDERPSLTKRNKPINPNSKSNEAKRKRPSHRKPPRTNFDHTSPLGVLTEFEIPNMLVEHHEKVCALLGCDAKETPYLTVKDVLNPVRDIINDDGVLDAFNWRELQNVQVLSMSAKGDGLAIIRSPTFEKVVQCQEFANERDRERLEQWKRDHPEEVAKEEERIRLEEERHQAWRLANPELAAKSDLKKNSTEENIDEQGQQDHKKKKRRRNGIFEFEPYRRQIKAEDMPKVQIATIPFAFPGDVVNIKVFHTNQHYVDSEIMEFVKLSKLRPESERGLTKPMETKCAYFGICSGCQYQSISYESQLEIKKEVVENAYKHFCKDEVNWEGKVLDTVASPLQYRYRTKLTPHYDVPRSGVNGLDVPRLGFGWRGKASWLNINKVKDEEVLGREFDNNDLPSEHPDSEKPAMRKRSIRPYFGDVLDIEDCIIGTDILRLGFVNERKKLAKEWNEGIKSKKGVTILLRENSVSNKDEDFKERTSFGSMNIESGDVTQLEVDIPGIDGEVTKTCVTDNQKIVSDYVDTGLGRKLRFDFIANEFFQNNNSILPKVIKYVRDNLGGEAELEYLVDAYCGSGLFSVSIASDQKSHLKKVLGVEISERAVEFAKRNAQLNQIGEDQCDFIQGKAEKLFEHIDFPKEKTGVILDPPRKGCDEIFLKQLSEFEPNRIVYVSCNVHSQARDVRYFLNETDKGHHYEIESIRGFDFFPQTHHVESVAVLKRK